MFNISKKITAAVFTIGMMIPQATSANFYVIPVGQTPIKASNAMSIKSDCAGNNQRVTAYTVPENKVFVVTSYMLSTCVDNMSFASRNTLKLGSNYTIVGDTAKKLVSFNLGTILRAGESIELTNHWNVTSTYGIQVNVNGYLANP